MPDTQAGADAPNGKRKVEIEDLYRFRLIAEPQVSPDGRTVAYVQTRLRKKENDYASNIWTMPSDGNSEPVRFTGGNKADLSPRWSPSGEELAFISTRSGKPQIWLISVSGGEARQLTRLKRGVGEIAWSPDGRWIAFTSQVDNEEDKRLAAEAKAKGDSGKEDGASEDENRAAGLTSGELGVSLLLAGEWEEDAEDEKEAEQKADHAKVVTRMHFKQDGAGLLERRQHIFIIPSKGGTPRQLTEGEWDAASPRWSPDGKSLAFLANVEPDKDYNNVVDIFSLPIDDKGNAGERRRVTNNDSVIITMDWLPSGDGFAAYGHTRIQEGALGTHFKVWTISLDGKVKKLTEGLDRSAGSWLGSDMRSGTGDMRPRFSKDGKLIYFSVSTDGAVRVYSVPVVGGEVKEVIGGSRQVLNFDVMANGFVFAVSTPDNPNDLFRADLDGRNERRLTNVNRDILDSLEISDTREFWLERPDGDRVQGWLVLPYGYKEGEKYPLVIDVHGGPHTLFGNAYFHYFQCLAARGYIVLYTNPRGSQGYSQAFCDAILNDWGGVDYDDLMASVDYAISQGNVDEARLGVSGGSYGGYMSVWMIGHTDRFKAAVASRMVSNLYSAWGSGDYTWMLWSWELEGSPQQRTQLYLERSPISYAEQIHTPLLLTHAIDDLRTTIEQTEQMYMALKVYGREVKMVRFPSGGHEVSRSGKPSLRVERLQHLIDWFDEHMK